MSVETNTGMEFAYGAGHIEPLQAVNPDLVYDAGEADYVKFLCGQGYSTKHLRLITGNNSTCSEAKHETVLNLNYPSFAISTKSGVTLTRIFTRTVTNVGPAVSTYKAVTAVPSGISVKVKPRALSFPRPEEDLL